MRDVRYIINPDGFFVREEVTRSMVLNPAPILSKMASEATYIAPLVEDLWVVRGRNGHWLFHRVPRLFIHTDYRVKEGRLVPAFHKREQTGGEVESLDLRLEFQLPDACQMWFASNLGGEIYHFWEVPEGATSLIRKPCLPNLFEDTKVCTGRVNAMGFGDGILARHECMLKACDQNRWGGDLRDSVDFDKMEKLMVWYIDPPYPQRMPSVEELNANLAFGAGPYNAAFREFMEWRAQE